MQQGRRAALYARFSSELQNARSVDDQLVLCADFAARNEWPVVGEYFDRAMSGATVHGRTGLQRLISDAEAGRFDVLVIEALDRLSRDQADLATIHKRLTFYGVDIIAVHDGAADPIQIGIRGLMGALYLSDLKHKVRRGLSAVLRDGRSPGGRPYGYSVVPGKPGELTVNEDEAAVVRQIFEAYAAGVSPRDIAANLNADGVPSPRGGRWSASTINGHMGRGHGILLNMIYVGRIVWNKCRMQVDPFTGRQIIKTNPPEEWQSVDVPHLAILDRDLFDRVQTRRQGAAKVRGKQTRRARKRILSGLLKCGKCGGGLTVHDVRGDVVRVKCSTARESGSCDNTKRYRLDKIEIAVIDGMRDRLGDDAGIAAFVGAYQADRRAEAALRGQIEAQVRDARAKIDRLSLLLLDEKIDDQFFDDQIVPLRAELAQAQARLDAAPAPNVVTLHPGALSAYRSAMTHLRDLLNNLDPKEDRELIESFRALIHKAVVHDRDDGGVDVQVIGLLGPLIGDAADAWGVSLVGPERTRAIPPVEIGVFAA